MLHLGQIPIRGKYNLRSHAKARTHLLQRSHVELCYDPGLFTDTDIRRWYARLVVILSLLERLVQQLE